MTESKTTTDTKADTSTSTDTATNTDTDSDGEIDVDVDALADRPRDDILDMLEEAIEEAHRKATNGRVHDPEAERVRQGWVRALANLVSAYRLLRNDLELEDMAEKLDALETRDEPLGGGR